VTRPWAGRFGVLIQTGARDFAILQNVPTGSETHPAFYSKGNRIYFPQGKAARTWSCPLASVWNKAVATFISTYLQFLPPGTLPLICCDRRNVSGGFLALVLAFERFGVRFSKMRSPVMIEDVVLFFGVTKHFPFPNPSLLTIHKYLPVS
jgi:hypothetical protein